MIEGADYSRGEEVDKDGVESGPRGFCSFAQSMARHYLYLSAFVNVVIVLTVHNTSDRQTLFRPASVSYPSGASRTGIKLTPAMVAHVADWPMALSHSRLV